MTDTTTTAPAPSAADAATDAALRAEIAGFDLLRDTDHTAFAAHDNLSAPALAALRSPPLSALSPADRAEVSRRLNESRPHDFEAAQRKFIDEVVRERAIEARLKAGVPKNAYQAECFQLHFDTLAVEAEMDRIDKRLSEVASHRTEIDPNTGQARAVPVPLLRGEDRDGWIKRYAELGAKLANLKGGDGERRLGAALDRAVADHKRMADQVELHREADALADKTIRDEELARLAKGKAAMKRTLV